MKRHLLFATLAVVLSRAMGLVTLLVLAQMLVPADFGVVAAVVTFLALIQLSSDLGMQATLVYEQERGVTDRVHTAFTVNLVLAVAVTALGVLLAPAMAAFFHVPDRVDLFRLASLNLLLFGLGNVHDGLLLREMRFDRRIRPQVAQSLTQAIVAIALAAAGLGAEAVVLGSLAGTAVWAAVLWSLTGYRPRVVWRPAIARSMIGYGGAASALEVVSVVASRSDALVIGRVLGDGALGLYAVAFRVPEMVLSNVAWTLSVVAFPALSRLRRHADGDLSAATGRMVGWLALYALPMAVGLAVLGQPIVDLLFPERFAAAGPVLSAVALTAGLNTVIFPLGDAGKASGKQGTLLLLNVVHVPLMVAAMVLAADAGIVGVAWAGVGATAVFVLLFLFWAQRSVGLRLGPVLRELRPGVAAAVGVLLTLGPLRLAPVEHGAAVLLAAVPLAVLGAVVAVVLLAPGTLRRLGAELPALLPRSPRPAESR